MTGSGEAIRSRASRRRTYTAALRDAYALAGHGPTPTGLLRSYDVEADPATIERYRSLLIAAAVARGGPDGAAVAMLLRRGYVLAPGTMPGDPLSVGIYPITAPGIVWLGAGCRSADGAGRPPRVTPGRSTSPGCRRWTWCRRMRR